MIQKRDNFFTIGSFAAMYNISTTAVKRMIRAELLSGIITHDNYTFVNVSDIIIQASMEDMTPSEIVRRKVAESTPPVKKKE